MQISCACTVMCGLVFGPAVISRLCILAFMVFKQNTAAVPLNLIKIILGVDKEEKSMGAENRIFIKFKSRLLL